MKYLVSRLMWGAVLLAPPAPLLAQLPTNSYAVTSACPAANANPSVLSQVNTDGSLSPIGTVTDVGTNTPLILNALGFDDSAVPQTALYGLNVVQPVNISNFNTPPNFYRISIANAQATNLGAVVPPPTPTSGLSGPQPGETGFLDYRQTFNFIGDGGTGSNYFAAGATFRVFFRNFIIPSRVADLRLYVGVIPLNPFVSAAPTWRQLDTSDPATTAIVTAFQAEVQAFITSNGTNPTPQGGLQDWVFDMRTGNLVSYLGQDNQFLTIRNPGTAPVATTTTPTAPLPEAPAQDIGSMFTDRDGNVYAVTANSGTIYKIDRVTGNYSGQSFGSAFGCSRGDAVSLPGALPLPVTLTRFEAQTDGRAVRLSWTTATEKDAARFEVQRSRTGRGEWQTLFSVPAANDAHGHAYSARDEAPLPGLSYYRLAMIDFDGSTAYSPLRAVQLEGKLVVQIVPNPSDGRFDVALPSNAAGATVELLSPTGQRVRRFESGGSAILPVDARELPAGLYYLRVTAPGGKPSTAPVVVNK